RGERMEAPGDAAGDEADEAHREDDGQGVGRGRERLAHEDLAAFARTREDRLQRVVVALRGDDVARDEGGDQRQAPDRHEEEDDERGREPRVADVPAKRNVVRAARLEYQYDDEDDRHQDRGEQTEVGPLLRQQLRQLPLVDLAQRGDHAIASSFAAARSALTCSPSFMPRKSSSRLAVSGTSAVTPILAWPSAIENAATASSSAWNRNEPSTEVTSPIPGWASRSAFARSGSGERSRKPVAAVASRSWSWPS